MTKQLEMFEYWNEPMEQDYIGMKVSDMVEQFATTAKQKKNESTAFNLVSEEFEEWYNSGVGEEDLKETADLVYVIYGYARVRGWNLDEAIRRVHENNMGRMYQDDGTIKFREDGKVLKNPNYPKVNLEDLV